MSAIGRALAASYRSFLVVSRLGQGRYRRPGELNICGLHGMRFTTSEKIHERSFGDSAFLMAMVSHLVITSGMLELLPVGDLVRVALINIILVLAIYGIARSISLGYYAASAISIILLASIWFYLYLFSAISGSTFNPAAGGLYFPGTLAALFVVAIHNRENFSRSIRSLELVILLYAVVYIFLNIAFGLGFLSPPAQGSLILGADDLIERAARIRISTSFVCVGFAISFCRLLERRNWLSLFSICVFAVALFMANSRGFSVFLIGACLMSVFLRNLRMLSLAGVLLVVSGALGSLYVAFTPGFDPLHFVDRDTSGRIRSLSIQIAQSWIEHFPLFGVGVPSGGAGYTVISNSTTFYPSDIGYIGTLFSHGLVGFIVYLSICTMACWSGLKMIRLGFDSVLARAFTISGITFSLYSIQAPVFLGQSGASMAALFIAVAFSRPEPSRSR